MKYTIKTCAVEDGKKVIGFDVDYEDHHMMIDKSIPLVAGKTDEEYMSEAFALAQSEINEWSESFKNIGKEWNPDTKTLN